MAFDLKPLGERRVVLTGATSGIGLATARRLAVRGAHLILVARDEAALEDVARECVFLGGEAVAVAADVGDYGGLERAAAEAEARYGGFDTWINDAGTAIYGAVTDVPVEDQRRLFETNYWGVVHGSLIAAGHFRHRADGGGGKIVNVGSVLSDRAMIYQGPYSASKHAVKAITDALRMELEAAGVPVSVTLIKPSAIDTPYMEHARNYMDAEGTRNPPPSYDPDVVAKAIEHACEHHHRDLVVGAGGWAVAAMGSLAPRLTDFLMEASGRVLQTSSDPGRPARRDNLYGSREDGAARSSLGGPRARRSSLLLEAQMHPALAGLAMAGLGLALAGALLRRR
ncbi:MAG: SDR family NAD(P)-dependent oxidoreductase [Geminicoccaceae bacterium]|nr:SDR family NAD(P)-dependent oxidoreductase [Geminicoccaceae bacterium]